MMFQYVLANLLANNDHALGALFLDGSGETVDLACAGFTPYEMRVVGAYLGIYLRQLEKVLTDNDLGEPRMIHIEKKAVHIYAMPLPDGYYLVLVQRHPALVARARATLTEAVEQLRRELFVVRPPAAYDAPVWLRTTPRTTSSSSRPRPASPRRRPSRRGFWRKLKRGLFMTHTEIIEKVTRAMQGKVDARRRARSSTWRRS